MPPDSAPLAAVVPWYRYGNGVTSSTPTPDGRDMWKVKPGRTSAVVPTTMGLPWLTTRFDTVMPVSAAAADGAAYAPRASAPASATAEPDLPARMHNLLLIE